jgi:proteasome lid subunit RPN8/RPN11
MKSELLLPQEMARQIEREGIAAYPNECCGILFGKEVRENGDDQRFVERIEKVENEFEENEQFHRFLITPDTLKKAEEAAATEGRLVLGFYHSHPDAPARPSEYDRQHGWPFYSYVIVSILNQEAADMTSWVMDEVTEQFERQEMVET